jgi:hypothetical protein
MYFIIEADERRPSRQLATLLAQHLDIPPDLSMIFWPIQKYHW